MKYEEALKKVAENWEKLKALEVRQSPGSTYDFDTETPIGKAYWSNDNLVWVYLTNNEEDYEGSQTYLGVRRDGTLVYEYQSHCSCDGYANTHVDGCPMPDDTTKSYELNAVPAEWQVIVAANVEKMLALL